jgi:ribonucleoside-diphosphate reductase alpha chain
MGVCRVQSREAEYLALHDRTSRAGPQDKMAMRKMATQGSLTQEISRHIWETKYRYRTPTGAGDQTIEDSWRRIATALAAVEPKDHEIWAKRFYSIVDGFKFLPAGRIQAGAGTPHQVTLFNCFVMGVVEDSIESIFDNLKEGAITLQCGGGVGYDFSTLRPRGTRARDAGTIASGPVSFMHVWDAMCATMLSTGARRGAMMATLRCDHPDIEEFITAKQEPGRLRHFNLSVQITDAFMSAAREGADWPLVFPAEALASGGELLERRWTGSEGSVPCRVVRSVPARGLWDRIMRATYDYAEPGVLFIDQINRMNNLGYREQITATNPCGEVPLPPYGACDLGSINLTAFVHDPFTKRATRLLDNVIDASRFPLDAQREQAQGSRRIGLGMTGLADALIMLGLSYGETASLEVAAGAMRTIVHSCYRTSIALAREKGSFPFFNRDQYLRRPFISALPEDIREGIKRYGIRNSHLSAIAPAGTISLLANNVSSGLEPVYAFHYERRVLNQDSTSSTFELTDYAWLLWRELRGPSAPLPPAFLHAHEIPPLGHLAMQSALQSYVDSSISKTINVPEDCPFAEFKDIYQLAFEQGLKGCTTFRPNPITGEVLKGAEDSKDAPHCCVVEREAD